MAGRIAEHPETLAPAGQFPRAGCQRRLLGRVEIADAHIKMHLLRMLRVWPPGRPHSRHSLEGQARTVRCVTDHHPVLVFLYSLHTQEILVKPGEQRGVGAVDDEAVPVSDHDASMPRAYDRGFSWRLAPAQRDLAADHATALRNTLVAQTSTSVQRGTSTARACQTAGPVRVPAASTRDAWTR